MKRKTPQALTWERPVVTEKQYRCGRCWRSFPERELRVVPMSGRRGSEFVCAECAEAPF